MNKKILFLALNFCLVAGILLKILHMYPLLADFLIGFSFGGLMILLLILVYKKLESKP